MNHPLLAFLRLHGFTLDADGRAVPLVVGPDPFAVALMPMALPTIPDGPSAKSLRRRAKLAARAGK